MPEPAALFKPDAVRMAETRIEGRIDAIASFDTQDGRMYDHTVLMPSHDEYSGPSAVSVRHKSKIGSKGDLIDGRVRVTGRRAYANAVDRETGEQKKRMYVNMYLQWLD